MKQTFADILMDIESNAEKNKPTTISVAQGKKILSSALKLTEAVAFYAKPDTYHAIGFAFDPPCGGFNKDFNHVKGSIYNRSMPGKTARQAIKQVYPDCVEEDKP